VAGGFQFRSTMRSRSAGIRPRSMSRVPVGDGVVVVEQRGGGVGPDGRDLGRRVAVAGVPRFGPATTPRRPPPWPPSTPPSGRGEGARRDLPRDRLRPRRVRGHRDGAPRPARHTQLGQHADPRRPLGARQRRLQRQVVPERWSRTLDRYADTPGCLWATVPDVVGDAEATEVLWRRWWSTPMRHGYRAAWSLSLDPPNGPWWWLRWVRGGGVSREGGVSCWSGR
jgi:hypothetical protein